MEILILLNNFQDLYRTDYNKFWKIIRDSEKSVVDCNPLEKTAQFLSLARVKKGNAEFNEYFMAILERHLIKNNPNCFFQTLLVVDEKSQKVIIRDLKHPIYTDLNHIELVFNDYRKSEKYKEIIMMWDDGKSQP